jgi:ankyrin repeat protein
LEGARLIRMNVIRMVERKSSLYASDIERGANSSVLHLAASSMAPIAYSFFSTLLRNPNISVNLQDYESGHTALHRALYVGNIKAARDLLMRHDIDLGIKDIEGLTAFDLYNGTVEGVSRPSTLCCITNRPDVRQILLTISTDQTYTSGESTVISPLEQVILPIKHLRIV